MSPPSLPRLIVSHWELTWSLNVIAIAFAGLYIAAAARLGGRWPLRRTLAFLAGIGCVLIALESGVVAYDDRLLSAHMVQHMLLLLPGPLLLLAGHPVMLVLRALPPARRPAAVRALDRIAPLGRPVPCLVVFSATLLLTHLPAFYEATLHHPPLHDLEHGAYLVAGTLLWWPVLGADPVPRRRLGGLARLIYMLAAMPAMALVGAYLNRHPTLVYPDYGVAAHAMGISAVADQAQAGAIMWVAGNTIMVFVGLWAVTASLVAEERRQQAQDARVAASGPAAGAGS